MAPSRIAEEIKILTPVGMIGYGFNEDLFWKAVEDGVDAIIADCGSTDSGPQKLARGTTTVTRAAYVHDLNILVAACSIYHVPILLGSAGGDGSDDHVQFFLQIVTELIQQKGYRSMNVITINSEIDKLFIKEKFAKREIVPCSRAVPELTVKDIDEATRIVGQMGLEPYVQAMSDHPDFDIIIGGRSYDPAMYTTQSISMFSIANLHLTGMLPIVHTEELRTLASHIIWERSWSVARSVQGRKAKKHWL